jgi:D-Tyr-tRNAtyr deacylase
MSPDKAPQFYDNFMAEMRKNYDETKVKGACVCFVTHCLICIFSFADGQFGAYMNVEIHNDGPVTITIDSRNRNNDNL